MTARQPVVYRAFDADGRLLYIGSTIDFTARISSHRSVSWWMPLVTRFDVEVHLNDEAARRAEMVAIDREIPAFNQALNQRPAGESMPLTEADLDVARAFIARGRAGYLPYPMRWLARDAA